MTRIPSFRPRGTLAVQEGGRIVASAEFLRWLDYMSRRVGDTVTVVEGEASTAATFYPPEETPAGAAAATAYPTGEAEARAATAYETAEADRASVQYATAESGDVGVSYSTGAVATY